MFWIRFAFLNGLAKHIYAFDKAMALFNLFSTNNGRIQIEETKLLSWPAQLRQIQCTLFINCQQERMLSEVVYSVLGVSMASVDM